MLNLGLIINPIAGMGGRVALKGTDGRPVLAEALRRGAVPEAGLKAKKALRLLLPHRDSLRVYTAAGPMGEDLCEELGLPCRIVYRAAGPETTADDTAAAARALRDVPADLILFAGGDGTARDICGAVAAVMASGTPMTDSLRDVVDLDEDEYRKGRVSARLYGVMRIPDCPDRLQSMKQSGFAAEAGQMEAIAAFLDEHMEDGLYYAVGSGSGAKCISRRLGLPFELLGVDVIRDRKLIARDVTEEQLWEFARTGKLRVIVSPIGGQGFLFGRGNHQFSPRILKAVGKDGITVLSPESKLLSIPGHTLRVDCGEEEVNRLLRGYYKVLCGYGYYAALPCL